MKEFCDVCFVVNDVYGNGLNPSFPTETEALEYAKFHPPTKGGGTVDHFVLGTIEKRATTCISGRPLRPSAFGLCST